MNKPVVPVKIASAAFPTQKPSFEDIQVVVDETADTLKLPRSVISRLGLSEIGVMRRMVRGHEQKIILYGPIWLRVGKRTAFVDAEITKGKATIGTESMSALEVRLAKKTSAFCLVPKHKNERHVSALGIC